jgi:hypothetical protein
LVNLWKDSVYWEFLRDSWKALEGEVPPSARALLGEPREEVSPRIRKDIGRRAQGTDITHCGPLRICRGLVYRRIEKALEDTFLQRDPAKKWGPVQREL